MSDKRRALVLGGGGPVGVAWEAGLAAGLASAGVSFDVADTVIGTSAGSITGAHLKAGADPSELAHEVAGMFTRSIADSGVDKVDMAGFEGGMEFLIGAIVDTDRGTQAERLVEVGRMALEADTISEDAFVGTFERSLGDVDWPTGFSCTSVDVETGEFVVWDEASGAPLARAVASSCSVPAIYPPVSVNGARYTDGGVRSPLNADLADGHETVVVISPMPLALPAGFEDDRFERFFASQLAEVDGLRAGGAEVELIGPDDEFLDVSGYGLSLMDFSRITPAVDAGIRLGKAEAERIKAMW